MSAPARPPSGAFPLFLVLTVVLFWGCPFSSPAAESDAEYIRSLNRAVDQSGSIGEEPEETGGWEAIFQMLAALAIVLGLIALAAYLLRRYGKAAGLAPSGRGDAIRIVTTKMLGSRRSLMLVRVRGQTLLLGVTPQAINCLTEIHEIEGEWAQPPEGDSSSFDRHLGRFVNQTVVSDSPDAS